MTKTQQIIKTSTKIKIKFDLKYQQNVKINRVVCHSKLSLIFYLLSEKKKSKNKSIYYSYKYIHI